MNEEEKIIEDIKEIINRCKECKFVACEQCEINWTQIKTIEHLLDLYNKEKEENKKLNYARNWYFEHFTSQACTPEQLHKILRFDYISKDKIKEKIEYNKIFNDDIHKYTTLTLQELLEVE